MMIDAEYEQFKEFHFDPYRFVLTSLYPNSKGIKFLGNILSLKQYSVYTECMQLTYVSVSEIFLDITKYEENAI
jgi:hypothetical protein